MLHSALNVYEGRYLLQIQHNANTYCTSKNTTKGKVVVRSFSIVSLEMVIHTTSKILYTKALVLTNEHND